MSYIRCLSNPEGIYIWGDGQYVNISVGKEELKYIPQKRFDGLLRKCNKYPNSDKIKYCGVQIEETFVKTPKKFWTKTDKEIMKDKRLRKVLGEPGNFKMRLSYQDWYIDMWRVTWEYIVRHNSMR